MQANHFNLLSELPGLLLPWFSEHARSLPWRADREPYHVWLSEIMLQQTRVEAVKPYYERFLKTLPSIHALANCEEETLLKLWEGLGYYSRVRNLAKAAQQIEMRHQGKFPETYAEIRALSGIGDYTAGAVASICFELAEPAVDGNVLRVVTRICGDESCIDDQKVKTRIREALRAVYPKPPRRGDFTQSLMELGATVCIPNGTPHCECCPCRGICIACREARTAEIPVRKGKKSRKIVYYTVFALQCGEEIAVAKREENGLLAGLWELPHLDGALSPQQALTQANAAWDCHPIELISTKQRVHIFTHIEWRLCCVHLICERKSPVFRWVTREQLLSQTALPTAFRICLPDRFLI